MASRWRLGFLLAAAVAASGAARNTAGGGSTPRLGTFGFDEGGMDRSVRPGDDFYRYANGGWLARTTIAADQSGYDRLTPLRELSNRRTAEVIQKAAVAANSPGSLSDKIGIAYSSYLDTAAIDAKGGKPLEPYLAAIHAIMTPSDLASELSDAGRRGESVPFVFFVQQDLKHNTANAAYLRQGGLGLPDRDYYLSDDARFTALREQYHTFISTEMRLAKEPDPDGAADRIIALETALARAHWPALRSRNVDDIYNPVAVSNLVSTMPGVDWVTLLNTAGLGAEKKIIVFQPSALLGEAKVIGSTPLTTMKEYLAFKMIALAAPLLSTPFANASFAFHGTAMSGQTQTSPRSDQAVDLVNAMLGYGVGQLYVQKYFSPGDKDRADELVRNVIGAMADRLSRLSWMSSETKARAIRKLAALSAKIGYPNTWRDYTKLTVLRGDVLGNAVRAKAFDYDRQIRKILKPVDRDEWSIPPQTASAYSSAAMNDVVVPAGILVAPFFDPAADPAVNYGAIGFVIGHEISHNFDDRGARFDETGNLSSWWTAEDTSSFKTRGRSLVAQYDGYMPLPGIAVNGDLTLSENLADLAGVTLAYDAYRRSLHGKVAPVLDGFTGDQRFFLSFAQTLRSKQRPAELRNLLATDPHTPEQWRINVVRNLEAWHAAFDVRPGQALYLPPGDRITIW